MSVKVTKVRKTEPQVHFVQKTIGGDTYLVMAQSQVQLEDEFSSLYYTVQNQSNIFLQPPFDPQVLLNMVQANNVLNQCVEVMEVNIDGTGHEFVPLDQDSKVDDTEKANATEFFNEPYPNTSFIKMRRKIRRELESVGYAYLEVLRNVVGDIVGLRTVDTHNTRMVKLDAPILVQKTLMRGGKEVQLQLWERQRRFAQRVAMKQMVYYREFGTARHVDRNTGHWEVSGVQGVPDVVVKPENRGTELIIFGIHPDVDTPYFVPRWVNQMPSVIGSRKAEEMNLEFLDSGGMPPAIIFIQGGTLAKEASDQLRMYLSGKNKNKHRAVVVEAQSSSGSLESAGSVNVKVERFGGERMNDAMFSKYDASCEEHVRVGFRLPPLFLGKPADYNFATAQTAYMVAEEQVFQPERTLFDEVMNNTIIKELGFKTLKFKSLPITLTDAADQIAAMGQAKDKVTPESFVDAINKTTGLNLEVAPEPQPDSVTDKVTATVGAPPAGNGDTSQQTIDPGAPPPAQGTPPAPSGAGPVANNPPAAASEDAAQGKVQAKSKKTATELIELAQDYLSMRGLTQKREISAARQEWVLGEVEHLTKTERRAFDSLLAAYTYGSSDPDLVNIAHDSCTHH